MFLLLTVTVVWQVSSFPHFWLCSLVSSEHAGPCRFSASQWVTLPRSTFDPVVLQASSTELTRCVSRVLCRLQGGDVSMHQDVLGPQAYQAVCGRPVFLQVSWMPRFDFNGLCSKTVHIMVCDPTMKWQERWGEQRRGKTPATAPHRKWINSIVRPSM